MEAAIPNLLIRTVTDPIDSPLSHGQPREISSDHDHSSPSSAVSFRKAGGGGGNGGGGGGSGSPLSQSPRSLHLEVKERKENSPGSIKSKPFVDWVEEEKRKDGGGDDRDRVLCLGNWTNTFFEVHKEVVDDGDLGQAFEFDAGERVANGDFGLGAAGAGAAVGVSQG